MTRDMEEIPVWCEQAGLTCRDGGDGTFSVRLQPEDPDDVRVRPPLGPDPLRLTDRVTLEDHDLSPARLAEVVESVVLGRSSLVDARPARDGRDVEVVVIVHPEGLNRHTFVEATFEIEKIRLLLAREVAVAIAAEHTLAALETMAHQAGSVTAAPSA